MHVCCWLNLSHLLLVRITLFSDQRETAIEMQEEEGEFGVDWPETSTVGEAEDEGAIQAVARAPGARGSFRFDSIGVGHRSPQTCAGGTHQAANCTDSPTSMPGLNAHSDGGANSLDGAVRDSKIFWS